MLDALRRPRAYLDILEEHFEELDYLWERRERSLFAPGIFLADLMLVEQRAGAHLDGLAVGELHSIELARPHLTGDDGSTAAAAALTLLRFDRPELDDEVVAAFAVGPAKARDGILLALRECDGVRIGSKLAALSSAADPHLRACCADLFSGWRLPAPKGIDALLLDDSPRVRILACGAVARSGGPWGPDYLEHALKHPEADVQRAGLETSAQLGLPGIDRLCRSAALRTDAPSCEAATFLGVLGDPNEIGLLRDLAARPPVAQGAIRGLGALGCIESIPLLLSEMKNAKMASEAWVAFARITGARDEKSADAWWAKERARFDPTATWQWGTRVTSIPTRALLDALPLDIRRDLFLRLKSTGREPGFTLARRSTILLPATPGAN